MLRINQIKLPPEHTTKDIIQKAARILRIPSSGILSFEIVRKSIDARKKPDIFIVYTVDVRVEAQEKVLAACRGRQGQVQAVQSKSYQFPKAGEEALSHRPIIIGTGPAGLFCGYMLARYGYRPILLERGRQAQTRLADVQRFWQEGVLDPASNVQFGEGGAGTFSDGKLNTLVKDPCGRNGEVLRILVEAGAPAEILYDARPHIGTDILIRVVTNLRRQILAWGGDVRFGTQVTDLVIENGHIKGVAARQEKCPAGNGIWPENTAVDQTGNATCPEKAAADQTGNITCPESDEIYLESDVVILAIGHSARDTFEMLARRQVPMEAKAFAVGLRMEHPRAYIDQLQYGTDKHLLLPAADYKVTAKTQSGRGVYSFCMCPGGYVVNASSEPGRTAVNGMSYSGRSGPNSNSAMIVTVTPEDYGQTGPLAGIAFQRALEERAFLAGKGDVPVERYGDYRQAVLCQEMEEGDRLEAERGEQRREEDAVSEIGRFSPDFTPAIKGSWRMAAVHDILPKELNRSLVEGIDLIGQTMKGFNDSGAFLSGVESRTSSPVRILRDETGQSAVRGLYPCGEGAGYAGGITSAAMDGILAAEKVASRYGSVIE